MSNTAIRSATTVIAALLAVAAVAAGVLAMSSGDDASGQQEHATVPELIEAAGPSLTDAQSEILADGVITLDEYNGAMEQVIACMETGGVTVNRLPGKGVGGALQIEAVVDTSIISEDAATKLSGDCRDRYISSLGMIWAEQNRPTAEQIAHRDAGINQCFVDNGQPQLVQEEGFLNPQELEPGSREFWIYFGCLDNGAGWQAPPE